MHKHERFNFEDFDLKQIAEVNLENTLNKAEIEYSDDEINLIKNQINETIKKSSHSHNLFVHSKLKNKNLDQIELPTFNYLRVLCAVNILEARRGPSPIFSAIKKQANKQKRLIDLL